MQTVTAFVFDDFETLDLFGPIEMLGSLTDSYRIQFASLTGNIIENKHGVRLATMAIDDLEYRTDILLIVGGIGTRALVDDKDFLQALTTLATTAHWVLSVCTGSALLARAGLLDNKRATSNNRAWEWVITQSDKVNWVKHARWVVDGKYYSASGVSAGMDMALGFIADRHGLAIAQEIAQKTEYRWQDDSDYDEFA